MSDSMFQPFNCAVVKTGNICGKSHKDIYVTKNASLGGSKHTIPETGQRSNECKLWNKCSIYHIRVIMTNRFVIWNCNKTI